MLQGIPLLDAKARWHFVFFIAGAYPQDTRASIKTIVKSNILLFRTSRAISSRQ